MMQIIIQAIGVIFFIVGVLIIIYPAALSAEPDNKERIDKGEEPMSEEEFAVAVKKGRRSGVILAVVGLIKFFGFMLLDLI